MLRIEDLTVEVDGGRTVLKNFNLNIDRGEVHVLFGPNGAGKSTLIYTILGYPGYKIVNGRIYFKGKNITDMPTEDRIKMGIGVMFQHPPKIKGVKLKRLLNICGEVRRNMIKSGMISECNELEPGCTTIDEQTEMLAERVNIPREFLERDVNVGFSGGEMKRSELLQLMILKPDFLIFDEPDSGVDVENVELLGKLMRELLQRDLRPKDQTRSGLIITHLAYILQFLGKLDRAHVLINGRIICDGNPDIIVDSVMKYGFDECKICALNRGDDVDCGDTAGSGREKFSLLKTLNK